jgi:hypothetical protein
LSASILLSLASVAAIIIMLRRYYANNPATVADLRENPLRANT